MAKIKIDVFCDEHADYIGVYIQVGENENEYVLDSRQINDMDSASELSNDLDVFLEYWKGIADSEKFEFEVTDEAINVFETFREDSDLELEEKEILDDRAMKIHNDFVQDEIHGIINDED